MMPGILFIVAALVVVLLIAYPMHDKEGQVLGLVNQSKQDDYNSAALNVLFPVMESRSEYGARWGYCDINDIQADRRQISKYRKWLETQSDPYVIRAYQKWLAYYERGCNEAQAAIERGDRARAIAEDKERDRQRREENERVAKINMPRPYPHQ